MKTFFVVGSNRVNAHVGEDYDLILEVEDQPTTQSIGEWANRIKDGIRGLWEGQLKEGVESPVVKVWLDGVTPYSAILLNLQIIMKADEGIVVELPYYKSQEVTDPEALEMLRRLGGKG
jgi:hypothetical protein